MPDTYDAKHIKTGTDATAIGDGDV